MNEQEMMRVVTDMAGFIGDESKVLVERLKESEALVWQYNQTSPTDTERQRELLKQILGTYNEGVFIRHGVHFDFGFNTHFLGAAYLNYNVTILDTSPVMIGDGCLIAPHVVLSCASHPVDPQQRRQGIEISRPITIRRNVWIGAHATVCGGVTVGDNSVIGAGAVVLHDIPANSVAAGVPARVIRPITDKDRLAPEQIMF